MQFAKFNNRQKDATMKIVLAPDPKLAKVCKPCEVGDKSIAKLAKQMAEIMYENNGCGLAAPQVGIDARLVVIDVDWDPEDPNSRNTIVLVNPEIVELRGEEEIGKEGCLSCPGINVPVLRKPWAHVRYYDESGEEWEIEGDGLLGRCLQHEIDHLNGKTLFESCSPATRINALRAYERARELGCKPGEVTIEVE